MSTFTNELTMPAATDLHYSNEQLLLRALTELISPEQLTKAFGIVEAQKHPSFNMHDWNSLKSGLHLLVDLQQEAS
jgi:hypothetical protein